MGRAGRHKRGILPKRLRPRRPQKKPKPKSVKERMKDVQLFIHQLEYRRATLPKVNNQRRALIECALTDRINQGRKLLADLEKSEKTKKMLEEVKKLEKKKGKKESERILKLVEERDKKKKQEVKGKNGKKKSA